MTRNSISRAIKHVDPQKASDALAIAVAISLPWSTSASGILIVLWILSVIRLLIFSQRRRGLLDLAETLKTPAGGLPLLLWSIAALGMLWADVSWSERFQGLGGFHKLLVIPILLVQFKASNREQFVVFGYFFSCAVLLLLSWTLVLWPESGWPFGRYPGVPVKDYIAQSGEFVLCGFGAIIFAVKSFDLKRHVSGFFLLGLALAFFANVFYVETSRTALVVIPALMMAFGIQRFGARGGFVALAISMVVAPAVWFTSPYIRDRVTGVTHEIQLYHAGDAQASAGQRLSFLKRSIEFVKAAPFIGSGTGSITSMFRQSAVSHTGPDATVSSNPHSQPFAIAIQIGLFGAFVLFMMWISHAVLFWIAGSSGWIGTLLVLQNIVSSQFNSHLFDFTQGWTYVFGVGVLGAAAMRQNGIKGVES